MRPRLGTPLKDWTLQEQDFRCTHDELNTENIGVLCSAWFALLQDSPIDDGKTFRQGRKFYTLLAGDLRQLIRSFAELGDVFLRSVHYTDEGTVKTPLFREFAHTPIFREYLEWYKTSHPGLARYILTFLWFGKKAEYFDPEFETNALIQWHQVEVENALIDFSVLQHVLEDLSEILRQSGLQVRDDDLVFRHGPGSVAERGVSGTPAKNNTVSYHEGISGILAFLGATPYADLVVPDPLAWSSVEYGIEKAKQTNVSRLMFVPKDYKSVRTICMEPTTYMWGQQAVLNAMVSGIERSRLFDYIQINSQEKNRVQALYSSEDILSSTLDLSAASDRVTWELVRGIFKSVPKLLGLLDATRTKLVETPTGDVVEVYKFAPMGSAVCFPTQSVIFALCATLVNHLHTIGVTISSYLANGKRQVKRFVYWPEETTCVYGDDIIIRDSQTSEMITLLQRLGFVVNTKKSFYGDSAVRESCGIYALEGKDITPTLFKVKGINTCEPESVLGRIELCNALFRQGFLNARNAILRSIPMRYYVVVPPESQYASNGYAVHGYEGNPGRKTRFNAVMSRTEVRLTRGYESYDTINPDQEIGQGENPITFSRRERSKRDDRESRYRYSLWLAKPHLTQGGVGFAPPSILSRKMTWGWRWTPVS